MTIKMTREELNARMEALRIEQDARRENEINERHEIKAFANFCGYTDVEPYEVVEVKTPNKVMIRFMDSEMITPPKCLGIGGFVAVFDNYSQKWENTSNEEYPLLAIRWSKAKKQWFDKHGRRFRMNDVSIKFYDNNF
jgi:hypothetical protein